MNEYRCIHCIQVYSVVDRTSREVWKIKPRRTASSRALTSASVAVVRTRRRRSVCDGLDVIHRRPNPPPPGHNPLGHNSVFCCRIGHRRTEPDGYFCLKLTLTCTPDRIRPMRRGPDPNRPTNGRKQKGLWPRGVCPGSFGRTPSETTGDSRTEFNLEFYALVNLKPQ